MKIALPLFLSLLATTLGVAACSSAELSAPEGDRASGIEWDGGAPTFQPDVTKAAPYTGDNATILEAQRRLPTGDALHSEVVLRSCGPLGGVCHNQKEYPDMRTPANFISLIGSPCNVQSGTVEGVFDGCERIGDRFSLDGSDEREIGWIELIPGDPPEEPSEEMPGLHLHFQESVPVDFERRYTNGTFARSFVLDGKVEDLSYATFRGNWHVFSGGTHIVAQVEGYQTDEINSLLAVGIEQADLNRNGTYGARPDENGNVLGPLSLIEAGDPERSYLVSRLRGHMLGQSVPGSRMPLANPPFSTAEMLALFCYIEGIPESGEINLHSDIDYKSCSYANPNRLEELTVEGVGQGWADRVSPLLEANCGGCHSADRSEGDLVLVGDGVLEKLLDTQSPHDPEGRHYIVPGDPTASYLYLKLINDPSIDGYGMPYDPLTGTNRLNDAALADIESWITDGAAP